MVRRPLDFLSTFLLRAPPNISMGTRTGSQNSKETMLFGKKKIMEYKMELKSYGVGEVWGWLKSLFGFFHKMLQKNMNERVG